MNRCVSFYFFTHFTMATQEKNTTGKYEHDYVTHITLGLIEHDKFALADIIKYINDDKLDDDKRKAKVSKRVRIMYNDLRDRTDFDDIIKTVPKLEKKRLLTKVSQS